MVSNKTTPTNVSVDNFISTIHPQRQTEAETLINIMLKISKQEPMMWGPSIIGFGSKHYKYDSGREGDIPQISFSPRKNAITIYFNEGFDRYSEHLAKLGKHKYSASCLYINSLADINSDVLTEMLIISYKLDQDQINKPKTPDEYIAQIPAQAKAGFKKLRELVKQTLPGAKEVLSYGVVGYKFDEKQARVFIAGWKDHLSLYPVPKDKSLQQELKPYQKGKGTLWFALDQPLPRDLIIKIIMALSK